MNADHVLYTTKRGNVSLSGLDADQPPVHRYGSKELKWYATVI